MEMMEADYEMPLELRCLVLTQINNGGAIQQVLVKTRVSIMWNTIVVIEEFTLHHTIPPHTFGPLSQICTLRGNYLCAVAYEDALTMWNDYKRWLKNSKPNFNLNAN